MKKTILASLAVAAMLASCSKESTMDVAITSTKSPIQFTAYAGSATTKGAPVNSNDDFKGNSADGYGSFEVSSYIAKAAAAPLKYFGFSTVNYGATNEWVNADKMYWPNYDATLYFGATSPAITGAGYSVGAGDAHALTFDYTVNPNVGLTGATTGLVGAHKDVMYAITEETYTAPADGSDDDVDDAKAVGLHFKHALTQVAFSATKDASLSVTVNSIQLCNVMSTGSFKATMVTDDPNVGAAPDDETTEDGSVIMTNAGSWTAPSGIGHYIAEMETASITIGASKTDLTDPDDALMLIPQTLTAWDVKAASDSDSYLVIGCTIKHADGDDDALIFTGKLFVPFSTSGIVYTKSSALNDTWAPGYKVTYNLHFGGGYYDPEKPGEPIIPEPGKTPDPDDVLPTLRPITYTTTVDAWESVTGPSLDLGDSDGLN